VPDLEWFASEDPLDDSQRVFAEVLRARARVWALDPLDSYLLLPDETGELLVYVDISDEESNVGLITVGAYLGEGRVRGDKLHGQSFVRPPEPSPFHLEAAGAPAELGAVVADWFESVLRRPIVRHEWLRSGAVRARRWSFGDDGQSLVESGSPAGRPDRSVQIR
jgi:hypothetical protein